MRTKEQGFTIPELLIMMIVTSILTTLVITFALNFWSSTASLQNGSETLATRLNAGDAFRDLMNVTSGMITQNSIVDANVSNVDPISGPGYWLQQHAVPGTVTMPTTGTLPVLYFQAPSVTTSKTFIMNGVQPYQDEFVLYMNAASKKLFLRTLVNPAASGDRLRTSCPAAQASTSCPPDRDLVDDVASVDLRYFSRSGNLLNYQSITDPTTGAYIGPDFPSVEVVEITVHLKRNSTIHGGTDTLNEVIIRVALRNG